MKFLDEFYGWSFPMRGVAIVPVQEDEVWLENSRDANEQIHTHIMVGLGCRFRRLFFKSTVGSGPDHDSGAKNDRGWIE